MEEKMIKKSKRGKANVFEELIRVLTYFSFINKPRLRPFSSLILIG